MEDTAVSIRKFPVAELEYLRKVGRHNGLAPTDGAVIRWAAIQYVRQLQLHEGFDVNRHPASILQPIVATDEKSPATADST